MRTGNPYLLTDVEIETLEWVSLGKTYSDISEIMQVTVSAINHRMLKAMDKLGAANSAGAVGVALRNGVLK